MYALSIKHAFYYAQFHTKSKTKRQMPKTHSSYKFLAYTGICHTNSVLSKYKHLAAPMPPFCETALMLFTYVFNKYAY